jgi:hypothetical protein
MSHSDSEFEEVGWSDLESLNGGGYTGGAKEDEEENTHVEVELPPHLLSESRAALKTDQSSIGSAAFAKKVGNLKTSSCDSSNKNNDNDDGDESSAWSHVGGESSGSNYCRHESNSSGNDCDASCMASANSATASSTISGFDIISLSGATKRPCNRCSFLNGPDDGVCGACGIALLVNPCSDADEQIAKNLQLEEEAFAFDRIKTDQKKRKSLGQLPIFLRSQVLASDVVDFVQEYMGRGFSPLLEASLVVLASRFIDCADKCIMNGGKISLAYYFSEKHDGRMTQIRQGGLGPYANVSTNMEAAYTHPESRLRRKSLHSTDLFSIPESDTIKESFETGHLGWIVATTEDASTIAATVEDASITEDASTTCLPVQIGQLVRVSSGFAYVRTLTTSDESLPLVCFDASLRNQDMIRSLWNGKRNKQDPLSLHSPNKI